MDNPKPGIFQRAGAWLSGEVLVSRRILVAGAVLVLILASVALD